MMRSRENNTFYGQHRFRANDPLITPVTILCIVFLFVAGTSLQSWANQTLDAVFCSFIFLISGIVIVALGFKSKQAELRAFMLVYAVCIFVGGLAQCYSLKKFGVVNHFVDAQTFFRQISPHPPFATYKTLMVKNPNTSFPLAILIWQQVYKLTWILGFKFGVYTGVMFNALVMGISGSITVRTVREVFGDEGWRLKRVGTFFAVFGLFILFGAILLRDSFTTFFNVIILWTLVRWLCRQTLINFILAIIASGISTFAMVYLRFETIVLFGIFWMLALSLWFFKDRLNISRLFAIILVTIVVILASSYILNYFNISRQFQDEIGKGYSAASTSSSRRNSLAMDLVVAQPLPIRLPMGSGAMMISPIPLWGYFNLELGDYLLIKGYHGICQCIMMPLILTGFLYTFMMMCHSLRHTIPLIFIAIYTIITFESVVATSLEQRHLAQFMPAFIIMSIVPDTKDIVTKRKIKKVSYIWLITVIFVHIAWMLAR